MFFKVLNGFRLNPRVIILFCNRCKFTNSTKMVWFTYRKRKPPKAILQINDKLQQPEVFKYSEDIDCLLQDFIKEAKLNEAVITAVKSRELGKVPSFRTLVWLIAALSQKGDSDLVAVASEISNACHLVETENVANFGHYLAEAYYKSGKSSEAIELFEQVFFNHRHLQCKVADMLTFFAHHVVRKKDDSGAEALHSLCLRFAYKEDHFSSLVNVWKVFFCDENSRFISIAHTILLENEAKCRNLVFNKLKSIIALARYKMDQDFNQRILEVCLRYQFVDYTAQILSIILYVHCEHDNLKSAQDVYNYATLNGYRITADVLYRYSYFLGCHSVEIPRSLLQLKYPKSEPLPEYPF